MAENLPENFHKYKEEHKAVCTHYESKLMNIWLKQPVWLTKWIWVTF